MSTDEIIKIISDEFDNHLTEIDNWNDAILKLDKQLFLNRVQQVLDLATVRHCLNYNDFKDAFTEGYKIRAKMNDFKYDEANKMFANKEFIKWYDKRLFNNV